ncbi:SRPBCC domain-containing protein [Nocardioides sp. KIGAM211]|uniref:SRPBCC domain-containing protein n=1 Tax=Nocardioides luti TaxID=2761101 RepID=A0A7X0RCN7_9ACTN|nr:SRPBCC domain-containing protein [Nocardioides luti]MBB6625794.1 SRPBCC domain-containing protein [Nocardioides luti]
MTSTETTSTGTMRDLDGVTGAVRVEDVYDTDIDDLWAACTTPARLSRWIAEVAGELREGATFDAVLTSTWSGPVRIDVCDAPRHLLLTMEPGAADETRVEAWLTTEGSGTRLVVEERGLPLDKMHFYAAGWQAHVDDLGRSLVTDGAVHPDGWSAEAPAAGWRARWDELTPAYREASGG